MRTVDRPVPDDIPWEDLITVAEAARLTGYSTRTILQKCQDGEYDRWPFSQRRIMILRSSIKQQLIARRKQDVSRQPELFFAL